MGPRSVSLAIALALVRIACGLAFLPMPTEKVEVPMENGFSPKPTTAPNVNIVELRKRATTASRNTCGWLSSDVDTPLGCSSGSSCAVYAVSGTRRLIGCCSGGYTSCGYKSTCYDSSELSTRCTTSTCLTDSLVLRCTDSARPNCATYSYELSRGNSYTCVSSSTRLLYSINMFATDASGSYYSASWTTPPYRSLDAYYISSLSSSRSSSSSTRTYNYYGATRTSSSDSDFDWNSDDSDPGISSSTPENLGGIIGGTVGGAIALFLIIFGIIMALHLRKQKRQGNSQSFHGAVPPAAPAMSTTSPSHNNSAHVSYIPSAATGHAQPHPPSYAGPSPAQPQQTYYPPPAGAASQTARAPPSAAASTSPQTSNSLYDVTPAHSPNATHHTPPTARAAGSPEHSGLAPPAANSSPVSPVTKQ